MIVKYIHELIQDHDRVIIPNFGAFLKSKGEIRNIIFNEFIKFNDGQLINHIAEKEGFPISDAATRVDDFVSKVKQDLEKGKKIEFEGVGTLYNDEQGRIRFSGMESQVVEADAIENNEKPKEKGKVKDESKETFKKEEKKPPPPAAPVKEKKEEKKAEKPPEPEKEKKAGETKPKHEEKKPQKEEPKASKTDPPKERIVQQDPRAAFKNEDKKKEGKKKKRTALIWLLIVLVILIGLAAWIVLDYDNVKGYFVSDKKADDQQQTEQQLTTTDKDKKTEGAEKQAATDEKKDDAEKSKTEETKKEITQAGNKEEGIKKQEAPEKKETPGKKETSKTKTQQDDLKPVPAKKYHIIAGVFSVKQNALDKIKDLEEMGFYGQIVAYKNNKYYVSYNSFKNRPDAMYELNRLLDKGYKAWLFYY